MANASADLIGLPRSGLVQLIKWFPALSTLIVTFSSLFQLNPLLIFASRHSALRRKIAVYFDVHA